MEATPAGPDPAHLCRNSTRWCSATKLAKSTVVSEPFQTQFGWHILEVTDRRTYDNTEEVKQQSCVARIRNSKLADESELWVRRIRDEAFVEKRMGSADAGAD